jgi:hypothetical protein
MNPNLRSGQEVTHVNAAAYLRSQAIRALRNRKVLLRAAALSFAVVATIGVASEPLRAQTQADSDSAQGRPALVKPSVGIFSFSFPGALNIDVTHETVTLPLQMGATQEGRPTWYVVTESSDQKDAAQRGVTFSNKMLNALGTAAVQKALLDHGKLVFEGTVDFSGTRVLVPGPNGFPPSEFSPGPIADAKYSPMVNIVTQQNGASNGQEHNTGIVINAPQVANDTGKSPSVVAIDYERRTVTLKMLAGFVDGQFTLYLHTDASSQLVAALQNDTYAPNLNAAPGIANDEPPSSRAAIIPVVNGIRGDANPMRQGLDSALFGEGDPFNVTQEQPSDPVHYTPIWDVTPVMWTDAAIADGLRVQLHSQDAVRTEALAGNIVSALPGTPDAGLGGIDAVGAISDCPIIVVFPGGVTFQGGVE